MCSMKGLQSENFQEPQSQEAKFTAGCQNWPLYHSAAIQWLSLVLITTVLIKAMNGLHENFSQNCSSFQILSSRKLEAALRSNSLKESNKNLSCVWILFHLLAYLSLIDRNFVGGNRPERSSMGFRRREKKKRKESRQHLPQPHYNSH